MHCKTLLHNTTCRKHAFLAPETSTFTKATLNCFQTWNKANNVVQKRINKNRLQHIFRLKTPQTKKTTLCLQTFDGNMQLPHLPNGNGVANKQRKACTNTTKHACPKKTKQTQSNCMSVHQLQQNALDKVADAKFCATKIAVRNVACCKTVAKQQNATRLKTKKTASACRFFHIFEKFCTLGLSNSYLYAKHRRNLQTQPCVPTYKFFVTVCQNSQQF